MLQKALKYVEIKRNRKYPHENCDFVWVFKLLSGFTTGDL